MGEGSMWVPSRREGSSGGDSRQEHNRLEFSR